MAEKRTRDKVALIVFVLLIAGATLALAAYFLVARNLNVAANQVDDTLGMMNDYTVLIYPGTIEDPALSAKTVDERDPVAAEEEADPTRAAETSAEGIEEALDAEGVSDGTPLSVADVFRQYSLKGASVLSLDDADLAAYQMPKLYHVGERAVGVVSIDRYLTKTRLEPLIDGLRERGADVICVMAPHPSMVGAPSLATIVLATEPDREFERLTLGSTFVAPAVPVDDVGVIAISSSNVISSAVLEGD